MIIKKYNKFLESTEENKDLWHIIPQSIKDINILFKEFGKELYLVGGAVRDFLNNENPKDFDLCTNATPDDILNIVGDRYKTTQQGKAFGVIVVYTYDQPMGIEIATFREDVYSDKLGITRNPNIKFSTIDKDVLRRDIPFNAMFYDLDKREIIDLVGGVEDIKNKITRFVGNPDDRIVEDPLRILRICRFSCRYNFDVDDETKKSIIKNVDKLEIISKERIWDEICKAFKQSKDFNVFLKLLTDFDMWEQIFPGVEINTNLIKSDDFLINITNLFKNEIPSARLENKLVQNFKMESNTARKIIFLLNMLSMKIEDVLPVFKKRQQCFITDSEILEWLCINSINDFRNKFVKFKPSVNSQELMDQGITGRELGLEIKRLEIENFKRML